MVRPPPGLVTSTKEVFSRAISTGTKGGASKLARPALKFQRPIKPQAGNSSSTAPSTTPEPSFFRLLYEGVFTSVRSAAVPRPGPYLGQRLAPRPPTSPFRQPAAGFSSSARPRPQSSRFGPTPRPTLYPTQTSQLGLGAARKFSSSGYAVFENVVHNAPLALRALADQGKDGLDDRKWRAIRREIRKKERTDVKGKGAMIPRLEMKENLGADFAEYFSSSAAPIAAEPLSVLFVLDPEIPFASTSTSAPREIPTPSEFDASYRLLPPSVLAVFDSFTQSYASHAHRLRTLVNRLSAAGLLDDPSTLEAGMYVDVSSGKRIWKVTFLDGLLTRSRLEYILRSGGMNVAEEDWHSKVSNWNGTNTSQQLGARGEGHWWSIEGGGGSGSGMSSTSIDLEGLSDPTPSTYLDSPVASTFYPPTSPPLSALDDDDVGLEDSQALVLPDPSSLELSPPLSPSLEPHTLTWSSSFDPASPTGSFLADEDSGFAFRGPEVQDFEAIESWSNGFEDESAYSSEWTSTAGSVIGTDDVAMSDGIDGVQQFLQEVERERERLGTSSSSR